MAGIIAAYLVAIIRKVAVIIREFSRTIVRVRWDAWLGRKLFKASRSVYSRIHQELRDDFSQLEAWLSEQLEAEKWQEVYLVARGFRRIKGVLYASLYPEYKSDAFRGPLCFVNCIVANAELSDKQALAVSKKLWKRLIKEVSRWTNEPREVWSSPNNIDTLLSLNSLNIILHRGFVTQG
jgi:hypothetical protein